MVVAEMEIDTNQDEPRLKAQNIVFAKILAGNEKKVRDKGLRKLKKWLTARSLGNFEFTENDLMTIWIGLFYSMWMSDMPLVQEELAESLSSLIHCFKLNYDAALLFIKCFNITMNKTWPTLDQYRVDKFSMLVRRFLRQSLVWLAGQEWSLVLIRKLMSVYADEVLSKQSALGFKLHFIDIFLEELAKVSKGNLSPSAVIAFLKPFVTIAATTRDGRVRVQLAAFFKHLIKQTDVALEYEDKFDAWKKAGFPGGDLNLVVPDSDEDNDNENSDGIEEAGVEGEKSKEFDPRAGSVHVILPQIQLPTTRLIRLLKENATLPQATTKGRRTMLALSRHFRKLGKEKYPFTLGKVVDDEDTNIKKMVKESARKMVKAEMKRKTSRKVLLKKRKRKLLALAEASKKEKSDTVIASDIELVNEEKPYQIKRKRKSEKRSDVEEALSNFCKKRKTRNVFAVSAAPASPEKSPIGKHKVTDEFELPPGWIVEPCHKEASRPKKPIPETWQVQPVESNPMKVSNDILSKELTKNVSSAATLTKNTDAKLQMPSKISLENDTENKTSVSDSTMPTSTGNNRELKITIDAKPKISTPPAFFARAFAKAGVTPKTPLSYPKQASEPGSVGSSRRISFNLARNMAQEKVEYFEQVQRSPQIPFDGARQPRQSALKPGLSPTPINPFYARKLNLGQLNSKSGNNL